MRYKYNSTILTFAGSFFLAAVFSLFISTGVYNLYLDFEIVTEKPTVIRVFYDTGEGFREELSSKSRLTGQPQAQHLRYGMPNKEVSRIRIDFGEPAKKVILKNVKLICLTDNSEIPLSLYNLVSFHNTAPIKLGGKGAAVTATGPDPQVVLPIANATHQSRIDFRLSTIIAFMLYPVLWLSTGFLIRFLTFFLNKKQGASSITLLREKQYVHFILFYGSVVFWGLAGIYFWEKHNINNVLIQERGEPSFRRYKMPVKFSEKELVRSDGLRIKANLYRPPNSDETHPAFLLLHGNYPSGQQYPLYKVLAQELANNGYMVMTIDFAGYGKSGDPFSGSNPVDVSLETETRAALNYLSKQPDVLPGSIGVIGHSMGADPALRVGAEEDMVSTITLIGPPRRVQERFHSPGDYGFFWYWANKVRKEQFGADTFPSWYDREQWRSDILNRDMIYMLPYLSTIAHKPVLFIDGERESGTDRKFLADYVKRCSFPRRYVTLSKTDHDCNVQVHGGKIFFDQEAMGQLVSTIDEWHKRTDKKLVFLKDYILNFFNFLFTPDNAGGCR